MSEKKPIYAYYTIKVWSYKEIFPPTHYFIGGEAPIPRKSMAIETKGVTKLFIAGKGKGGIKVLLKPRQ
jgi:hypothetical protein